MSNSNQATDVATIGIAIKTDEITGGIAALDALADQGPRVERSMTGVETAVKKTGKSLASLGGTGPGLKDAPKQIDAAAKSMDGLGISTKQTAAALRGVPAQFTDIITSIQGGQAPLTVFLQQGDQLKDMFGGAGAAARALGGYVIGLVNPLTLAASSAAALASGYFMGSKEAQEFTKSLVLSGNAAGTTSNQLADMAASIGAISGSQGKAAEVLAQIAATGAIGATNLTRFAKAAIEFEKAGGSAAEETAKAFTDLERAPLQAAIKLNQAQNFLTRSTYDQIKVLEDQGLAIDAARVAQETYAQSLEQRAPALLERLGYIEQAWLGIKSAIGGAGNALLDIGRTSTAAQQIKALQVTLADLDSPSPLRNQGGSLASRLAEAERLRPILQEQVRLLQQGSGYEALSAQYEAQRSAQVKAAIEFDREGERYRSKAVQLEMEIARARNQGLAAGRSQLEIEARIAAIKEKSAGKNSGSAGDPFAADRAAAKDWMQYYVRFTDLADQASGKVGQLTKTQVELVRFLQSPGYQNMAEPARQLALDQAYAAITAEQLGEATKEATKATEEAGRSYARWFADIEKSADAAARQVLALQDEERAAALAATSNLSLAQAVQEVAIARLQEQQAREMSFGDDAAVKAIQREIEERRKLIGLIGSSEARDASKKAAEAMASDWKSFYTDLNRGLTDSLYRAFESGKGFFESFWDSIKNTLKSTVLKIAVQAVMNPISQIIGGTLGLSGLASAGVSAAGSSAAGSLLSAVGLGGLSFGSIGSAIGAGFMSTIGGSTIAGGGAAGLLAGGASTGTGIAGMVGAALPWVGAAALVGNALGLFRKTEYKGTSLRGTLGEGDINAFDVTRKGGSLFSGPKWRETDRGEAPVSDSIQMAYEQMRLATAGMAEQLGLNGDAIRKYTQSLYIDGNGKSPEEMQKLLAEAVTAANDSLAKFALGTTQYTKEGESASQTLARLSGSLQGVNYVLDELNQTSLAASLAGGDMADQLAGLFGGLDSFVQTAGSYYQNYYSEAERAAKTTEQVTKGLAEYGLTLPASRDAFRALVEAQDLTTESGRKAYAALLQLSPAFASIVEATDAIGDSAAQTAAQVKKAAEEMAEAGRRAISGLMEDQGSLMVDLLRAQGNGAGADALARQQALAGLTGGLSAADAAAVTAIYDYNQAIRDQIKALDAAAEAQRAEAERVAAVASERYGLEGQLLQLQGDTATIRARELAALDESNRALQQQIYALQDQQAAADKAAAALQALDSVLGGLGSTRFDLENQLLGLQGKDGEVAKRTRERDLAELTKGLGADEAAKVTAAYDYNNALRDQIAKSEAARAASEALARAQEQAAQDMQRAAEQVKSAWQSITDSIYGEVQRIRGLISGDAGQSFAGAQAEFAIRSAQARAGDAEAAKLLPGLSQTLLQLAEAQATSLVELQRIRAQTAASLEKTGAGLAGQYGLKVPKLNTGTNYLPRDMLIQAHEGEAVVPRAYNPAAGGQAGGNAELIAEIKALREENRAQAQAMVRLQNEVARDMHRLFVVVDQVTEGGSVMRTEVVA